jgi:hypothetical protein
MRARRIPSRSRLRHSGAPDGRAVSRYGRRMSWKLAACIAVATAAVAVLGKATPVEALGTLSVSGTDQTGFIVNVNGNRLPGDLASSRARFGHPSAVRRTGFAEDPSCRLSWHSLHLTGIYYHGYGGVRSSCASAAPTLKMTFGPGWMTDRGVTLGTSVATLRRLYPGAVAHGSRWVLISSYPGWGGEIPVLAAQTHRGRVVSLSVAGPEAWDE